MAWNPGQPPPWLAPSQDAGNGEDPFLSWATAQAAQEAEQPALPPPPEDPVPDVAWAPPNYDFTEAEANPPNFDFSVEEANPAPPNFDFTVEEANPPQPINPYPVKLGRPRNPDLLPQPVDPYAIGALGPTPGESPVPDVAFAAPGGQAAPSAPLRTLLDAAPTSDQLDRAATDREMGASEKLIDNETPTADEAAASANESEVQRLRRDPEALIRAQVDEAAARASEQATRELAASEQERSMLEDSIKRRELARTKAAATRAKIEQDAARLADETPFEAFWSSRSTLGKISGIASAIWGGLMSSRTGGRNSGIDFLLGVAKEDADQKWKAIQVRREMNGEAAADAESDFATREAIRRATVEQLKRKIAADMAMFDPQGTAARRMAESLASLDAAQAQAAAAAEAEDYARAEKAIKADQDQQRIDLEAGQLQEQIDARMARERRLGGGGGGGGGSGPGGPLFGKGARATAKQWMERVPGLDLRHLDPDTVLTYDAVTKAQALMADVGRSATDASRNDAVKLETKLKKKQFEDEREVTFGGRPLYVYGPDGKPLLDEFGDPQRVTAQTPDEGKEIRKQVPNNIRAVELLYEARAIRRAMSTGATKLPWSNPRKRLEAIGAEVVKLMKAGTQGMSSDEDMNKIAAAAGVKNLLSIVGQDAAIEQGIRLISDGLNGELRNHYKYNGPALRVPDPYAGARPERDEAVEKMNKRAPQPGFFSRATWDPTKAFDDNDGPSADNKSGLAQVAASVELGGQIERGEKGGGMDDAAKAAAVAEGRTRAAALKDAALSARDGKSWADTIGSGNPVKELAAAEFWRLKNAGNPAIADEWDKMDRGERAALIAHLPGEEWRAALAEVFEAAKGAK